MEKMNYLEIIYMEMGTLNQEFKKGFRTIPTEQNKRWKFTNS